MKNVKIASALAISAFALFAFIPEKLSLNLHKFGGKFNNLTVVADTASKNFATNAAAANMMEIETGNLALKKASNQRVKAFAQMMVKDHTMAGNELKTIVASKGIMLPSALSKDKKMSMSRLSSLSGAAFDKSYMEMMVKDHKKAVVLFTKGSKNAKDAQIRSFATKTLPTLKMHSDSARAINNSLMTRKMQSKM